MVIPGRSLLEGVEGVDIGGKAEGLVRLLGAGVEVPEFFVLPPDAHPEAALDAYAQSGWGRVAVRSSAMGEDGDEHSFAGMYETVLGVRGGEALLAAIQTCRESVHSARLTAYRAEHGLAPSAVAVVVQELVEGEASGVLFSRDPADPERALISAAWGLGEGVVQGSVPADTFRVSEDGVIESFIAHKDSCVALDGGEPAEVEVPVEQRERACMEDPILRELAELGWRLELAFGGPQDIEWTVRDGCLVVLQARPITRPIPTGRRLLWDNSNIIESYYGPTLPLTYSFAAHAYTIVYQLFSRVMGVDERTLQANSDIFPRMIGLVRGRIYYNLNAWYRVVSLLPGYRWNREFMEQMMGVSEVASDADVGEAGSKWSDLPRLLRLSLRLGWRVWRLDSDVRGFHAHFERAVAPYRSTRPISEMEPHELLDAYHDLERQLLWAWHVPIVNDFFVMIGFGMLKKKSEKSFPDHPELHNQLLAGDGGLDSTRPTIELIAMASRIREIPEAHRALSQGDPEELWKRMRRWPELRAEAERWIQTWGDRSADELKLEQRTLRQEPHQLMGLLQGYLRGEPVDASGFGSEDRRVRAEAESVVQAGLGLIGRWRFRRTLRFARTRVRDRENLRFLRTRIFGLVRELFIRLGEHMAEAGAIDGPRDVFWLTQQEAWGWVRGTTIESHFQQIVALRRDRYAEYAVLPEPSDRFHTWGPVGRRNEFLGRPRVVSDADLSGLSAFPGVVEGRVRRVENPHSEPPLEGDILVTYRTDPGWVPLFPQASALLVERGSLLSHSAVVAREMGIPTIVGIEGLMERLKTGDRIRIDAGAGSVEILDPADT